MDAYAARLLANFYVRDWMRANPVSDAQLRAEYDKLVAQLARKEYSARHILVENEADARKILEDLKKGKAFTAIAKEVSKDTGSKDKGGEYTFPRGMMVKAFEDAAFAQELNAIGPLVETPFGFHIIKTTQRNEAGTVTLEEAHDRLKEMIERRDRSEAIRTYIEEIRKKARIEYPGR